MAVYYAVKLTKIDKQGKPKPRSRTFGLLELTLGPPKKPTDQGNIASHLILTDKSPKNLGIHYGDIVANSYDPSHASLSFKTPFDIIPGTGGKNLPIYKADDLPHELRPRFIRGMLEEIADQDATNANSMLGPRKFITYCQSKA